MKTLFISLMIVLLSPVCALRAQSVHWQCDVHQYEFDMTVYVTLKGMMELSNYEIAAFCGEECRGIAELIDAGPSQVGYMRIRSNVTTGETITFRVYNKISQKEIEVSPESISFSAGETLGQPSSPIQLNLPFIVGDANGDGEINVGDVATVINYILKRNNAAFVANAADVNGDGEINVGDVSAIINIILKRS